MPDYVMTKGDRKSRKKGYEREREDTKGEIRMEN
jgi:hypothetical protein